MLMRGSAENNDPNAILHFTCYHSISIFIKCAFLCHVLVYK